MQKIYFKKVIDLNNQLKELVTISVDESINYKLENNGMRAYGSIMINGDYKDEQSLQKFQESIDIDILAQFSKIEDKNEFHIKIEDFDYSFQKGNLSLVIQACIYGVKDDEDRYIETDSQSFEIHDDEDVSEEIENLLREQEQEQKENVISMDTSIEKELEKMPIVHKESLQVEDIDDDSEDIGIYYLYVAQNNDTYHSIAERYQIDEYILKEYNHDRPLTDGTIIIVPYHS